MLQELLQNLGLSDKKMPPSNEMGGEEKQDSFKGGASRTFTIDSATGIEITDKQSMRYISKSPISAAKKATRRLFDLAKKQKKNVKQIRFVLRETTSGAGSPTYKYVGFRENYDKPITVSLNGNNVTYKYKYTVKSCLQKSM